MSGADTVALKDMFLQCGWGTVDALLRVSRGRVLAIPRDPELFARVMSSERAAALCERFSGCRVEIPTDDSGLVRLRDETFGEDRKAGLKIGEIARRRDAAEYLVRNSLCMFEG